MSDYVIMSVSASENIDRFFTGSTMPIIVTYEYSLELNSVWPLGRGKLANIHHALEQNRKYFKPGDYFWFPDPDLLFAPHTIEDIFATAREHKLDLSQPAVAGYTAHSFLYKQGSGIRQVPFVEVMCPLFSVEALARNAWTFTINNASAYGTDMLWGKRETCYVMDNCLVTHPTPSNFHSVAERYGFPKPDEDLERMKKLGYV
jgi:hypothetical protein